MCFHPLICLPLLPLLFACSSTSHIFSLSSRTITSHLHPLTHLPFLLYFHPFIFFPPLLLLLAQSSNFHIFTLRVECHTSIYSHSQLPFLVCFHPLIYFPPLLLIQLSPTHIFPPTATRVTSFSSLTRTFAQSCSSTHSFSFPPPSLSHNHHHRPFSYSHFFFFSEYKTTPLSTQHTLFSCSPKHSVA